MMRTVLSRLSWFLALLLIGPGIAMSVPTDSTDWSARAKAIHQRIIALDAHIDIPQDFGSSASDPAMASEMQFDLPKFAAGGLSGAVLAVFVLQGQRTAQAYAKAAEQASQKLSAILKMAAEHSDRVEIAYDVADIERIHAQGKRFLVVSMLNGYPLGPQATALDDYLQKGVRQIGFTHAGHNALADSSRPQAALGDVGPEHDGLSDLGRSLVQRLNRQGVIIDVSQLSSAALAQVCELTVAPVVASHSGARGQVVHPRNLSDAELQRVADTGGVVHVVAFSAYLLERKVDVPARLAEIRSSYGAADDAAVMALPAEQQAAFNAEVQALLASLPRATVSDLVDSIDYTVQKIGVDHVGIASDFGHGGGVIGWMHVGESYNVTAELLRRGYSEQEIAKLWGGNWLRVFREVGAVANTST